MESWALMASIYKHKQYGYQIRYTLYYLDGSRRIKYKLSKNKENAYRILKDCEQLEQFSAQQTLSRDQILYAIHKKYISPEESQLLSRDRVCLTPITWDTLTDVYRTHVLTVGSPHTRRSYPYKIRSPIAYFQSIGIEPQHLDISQIQSFITHRRQTAAKATINKELNTLRVACDYLVKMGILTDNPARKIAALPNTPERMPRCMTPDNLKLMLRSLIKYHQYCRGYFVELIYTYLFTGLRRYELLQLRTINVDTKNKLMRVQGKGNRERIIEIHPYLHHVLQSTITKNIGRQGPYFFGGHETPIMTDDSMGKAFREFLRKEKLYNNEISLHTLRHTFISYLVDSGVPLRTVQEIAGHSSLKTTLRYTHVVPSQQETISRLDYERYF